MTFTFQARRPAAPPAQFRLAGSVLIAWTTACSPAPTTPPVVQGGLASGTYTVGSPPSEPCRTTDGPRRSVQLDAIEVDPTEVTQQEWSATTDLPDPTFGPKCENCPVDSVTHTEARAYCAARSVRLGLPPCDHCEVVDGQLTCTAIEGTCTGFRLPTADEWEAAARGGTAGSTWAGNVTVCMRHDAILSPLAWTKTTSSGFPHPTGTREPNPLGLFDLLGNVAEWTADPADDHGTRILRGGSWYHNAEHARASAELRVSGDRRLSWAGFRCVRNRPPELAAAGAPSRTVP